MAPTDYRPEVQERISGFLGMKLFVIEAKPVDAQKEQALIQEHLGAEARRATPHAYDDSRGHSDGDTVEVVTTDVDFPGFDQEGVPQTDELALVERFAVSADNRCLNFSVVATRTAVFTEPVLQQKQWLWMPGEEVMPYGCGWDRDNRQMD